jgi:hypothetical protein
VALAQAGGSRQTWEERPEEREALFWRVVHVHPGPKVGKMLERIKPFYLQSTPKQQRHHLYVFLGMCAYLMQHCLGLKQALHSMYQLVAADPFRYGETEMAAFDRYAPNNKATRVYFKRATRAL